MILKILGELALVGAIASVFFIATRSREMERAAEESAGREYMRKLDDIHTKILNRKVVARWLYETNITKRTEEQMQQSILQIAEEEKENWKETMSYLWHEFEDVDLKTMFKKFTQLGTPALPDDLNERLMVAINKMQSNYATATICDYDNRTQCDLKLEPALYRNMLEWMRKAADRESCHILDIINIFASSRDPEMLKVLWLEWFTAFAHMSGNYNEYVQMNNEAAKLNGFDTVAEWWLSEYDTIDIEEHFITLWKEVKPLYLQLHTYVRRQLLVFYGNDTVSAKGTIPAHLLGDVLARSWRNVENITRPFPNRSEFDVTETLVNQNYTALKMFEKANEFFISLNMSGVSDFFWDKSILVRPHDGRDMICETAVWDFYDREDFRVQQCTSINDEYLAKAHHAMARIQYFMQYKDQPVIYRAAAGPGFHEAVGDVISMTVTTPKHLHMLGLLDEEPNEPEDIINHLYKVALEKIPLLAYAYMSDTYRYNIFRGGTTSEHYNCHYWKVREQLQGVEPPIERNEKDFDPAADYRITADLDYMRIFVSQIIQFQLHRSLCQRARQYSSSNVAMPISGCNLYNSTEAGHALAAMLRQGSSKPWPDVMESLTGQRSIDVTALLEYFQPLHNWLKAENEKTEEFIGWESSTIQYCTREQLNSMKQTEFIKRLNRYVGS